MDTNINKIQVLIQSNHRARLEDISDAVVSLDLNSSLTYSPDKCVIRYLRSDTTWGLGSIITILIDGIKFFKGYIFEHNYSDKSTEEIICYDQLRYWKGTDVFQYKGLRLHEIFADLCKRLNMKYRTVNTTRYVLPENIWDNATYLKVWQDCNERNSVDTGGSTHFIRDNFGTIELHEANWLFNNTEEHIVFTDHPKYGQNRNVISYNYTRSIDKKTYNYVKVVNENTKDKRKSTYVAKNDDKIMAWGRLQHLERTSEELTDAQVRKRANDLLNVYGTWTNSLDIQAIGNLNTVTLRAGDGIIVEIQDLWRFNYQAGKTIYGKPFLIKSINHSILHGKYIIDIEVDLY